MKKEKTILFRILLSGMALLLCGNMSFAQSSRITGKVVDSNNNPLIGVTVMVVGTSNGTTTNVSGEYSISASPESVISFSYLGYSSAEVTVGTQTTINVTLSEGAQEIEELVVIGYGTVRKKDLTGATGSVSGEALATVPVTTAAQALSGKIAGVNITTASGAPGAATNVKIRGGTSITQGTAPLYIVDGFQMEDALEHIDANDIESIDVMKDASATAIYGARGSNGVIIITTKSGVRGGKTSVTYNAYVSFEKLGKKIDLMGVEDYVKYQYEYQTLRTNETRFANMFGGDVTNPAGMYNYIENEYRNRKGIDWQDEVFGGYAVLHSHNVNISGGSDRTSYMLSYNYTGQDGILAKSGYDRNSVRAKINHELWKGVRIDFNTNFQNTVVEGGGSLGGTLKLTALQPPTGGIRFTNEEMLTTDLRDEMELLDSQYDINNPIITNDAVTQKKYTRINSTNFGIEVDILKNLTARSSGSYMWQQVRDDYWDDGRTKAAQNNQGPFGKRNNSEKFTYQITNTLTWRETFGRHNITVLAGQETYYTESMNLKNEYRKFPETNFGLNDVSMAGEVFEYKSDKKRTGMVSVFGRVMYNFDDRYLVTGTLRHDGTSKFAKGHKWGTLPSVSAAWRVSEEAFMKDQNIFSNLKFRVGYGTTGNCDIDNNMYATDYGSGIYGIGSSAVSTLKPGDTLGNPYLKWEKTTSTNIGVDLSLLRNRINLTADFYNNKSDNLLIKADIPTSTGYKYQYQNMASIRNRGFEFVLNTINVQTRSGFTWTSDLNMTFNRSKVLDLFGSSGADYLINTYDSRISYYIEVGKPLGQFYGYKYDGVYTTDDFTQNADGTYSLKKGVPYAASLAGNTSSIKPGDIKYKTVAGNTDDDGTPIWDADDRTIIGSAEPKFYGGFNNTFTYKGFDLSVFMTFSYGNDVFDMNTQRFIGPYLPNQNTLSTMKNHYKLVDPVTGQQTTNLTRLAELNPNQYSKKALWSLASANSAAISSHMDYYLQDGSYLRLNQITLGYTLPKKLVEKARISNCRVYFTMNNIYTFTSYKGYDPEVVSVDSSTDNASNAKANKMFMGVDNSAYPRTKSFVVGLNLTF